MRYIYICLPLNRKKKIFDISTTISRLNFTYEWIKFRLYPRLDKSIRGSWDFNLAWTHLALKTMPILGTHGSTMTSGKSAAVASTSNTSCARAINLSRCRIERLMDIRGRCVRTVITADLWACVHLVNSRELPRKRWYAARGRRQVSREPD